MDSNFLESVGIKFETNQSENSHKFEFVVCCSSDPEVKNGKPHPDAFDIARKRFDPVPEARKCLAFEDSINGVKSAISQGSRIFRFDAELQIQPKTFSG